ncbi:hypothetical protein [Silvibacterium acidisoli]|uniref:hypothetical protein n=1 Tax=Acidobacteriaceae bacterium ZG23-2 TaxID=2883246 RepID=UPI00406C4D28
MPPRKALAATQPADAAASYQKLYDALGRAYWDASNVDDKDTIHGAMEAIGKIITAYDKQDLANNTDLFIQLTPTIKAINAKLKAIQAEIDRITKNISTAADVVSTINKALSLFPGL